MSRPRTEANPAERKTASRVDARHVVAAVVLLDDHAAFGASLEKTFKSQ